MAAKLRIMISAGEASGDRLGAGLARALLSRRPDLELFGMGGEKMAAAGVRLVQDAEEVAVVGITEVLRHLPEIRRAKARLEEAMREERPAMLVPIDFPDFNLRLSRSAVDAGVPVVYFVSPQVWAWRPGRVKGIRRLVRRMLVLFPFETRFYEEAGVPVSFVGHPLAERAEPPSREELCSRTGLDPSRRTVALMPGSRRVEVERLLPVMLEAGCLLAATRSDLQFLVPVAPGRSDVEIGPLVSASGLADVRTHRGDFPQILTACDAGVVSAGTASLEAAVTGLPIAVVYRINLLSYLLGRALVKVEHVALPNLVAGRQVVPELIQGDCTPQRIAEELARYLDDPVHAKSVHETLLDLRGRLGGGGIYQRAADAILAELDASS